MVSWVPALPAGVFNQTTAYGGRLPGTLTSVQSGPLAPVSTRSRQRPAAQNAQVPIAVPVPTPAPVTEITVTGSPWQVPLGTQFERFLRDVESVLQRVFGTTPRETPLSKAPAPVQEKPKERSKYAFSTIYSGTESGSLIVDMMGAIAKASDFKDPSGYEDTGTASGNEPAGVNDEAATRQRTREYDDRILSDMRAEQQGTLPGVLGNVGLIILAIILIILGLYFSRGGSVTRLVSAAQEGVPAQ